MRSPTQYLTTTVSTCSSIDKTLMISEKELFLSFPLDNASIYAQSFTPFEYESS